MVTPSEQKLHSAVQDTRYHRRVAAALDALYAKIAEAEPAPEAVDIGSARIVIFSDQHKGARNRADDFRKCERAYNAALAYYDAHRYTLIELGDVEELWEERPATVIRKYRRTLELSAAFTEDGRYIRIWGNHDDAWSFDDQVRRHLHGVYGSDLRVEEGVRLRVVSGEQAMGWILLVHGHQGTKMSERFGWLSRIVVRFIWRPFQRLTGISLNTPAKDWVLREKHNIALYSWVRDRADVMLIAGHTHRPVFKSQTHAAQVQTALDAAHRALENGSDDASLRHRVAELSAQLEWIRAQDETESGPEGKAARDMTSPCYFNTGCCAYYDGDITGLEISDGEIRLVRWPDDDARPLPFVLARMNLAEVFDRLGHIRETGRITI